MKSKRKDGRGHWVAGRPRSTLTDAQVATVLRKLQRALQAASAREVGRLTGVDRTQLSRIVSGEHRPSERTYALVMERL